MIESVDLALSLMNVLYPSIAKNASLRGIKRCFSFQLALCGKFLHKDYVISVWKDLYHTITHCWACPFTFIHTGKLIPCTLMTFITDDIKSSGKKP